MAFFGRYTRIMRVTYLALMVIAAVLFLMHVRTQYRATTSLMDERFHQTADSLDAFVKAIGDHVEAMRATAEQYWRGGPQACPYGELMASVRDRADGKAFALEPIPPNSRKADIGNLTGAGSFRGRSATYYKGARVALGLTPLYRTTIRNLPSITWAYYTSVDDYIIMYPWVPWKEYHYSEITHTGEFYTLGLPRTNPARQQFWTGVYVDQCGKGLMVTCGAPVYDKSRFVGTVAADATLDALNTFITRFPYRSSTLFILNDRGELLAHPRLVRSTDPAVKSAKQALPADSGLKLGELKRLTPGREYNFGRYVVVCQQLRDAPWRVVMVTPRATIVRSVVGVSAVPLAILLVGMTAMLLVANRLTRKEFIEPAAALVNHIDTASREPDTAIPPVPAPWRSWFEVVSKVFAEHRLLLEQLREQNEHLEDLVAQRTAEVSRRNDELAQAMDRLKEMQRQIVTQEKMAALGGLTAGIAHEIKNPLNFVNNFSELSLGLLDETLELLCRNAERIDPADFVDMKDLVADLRQNAEKINEHGKRADSIVRGMLLHSRGKSGQRQPTDLNGLVAEYVNLAYHGMRAVDAAFNVKIETEFDPEVGTVAVVPQDLSRAVLNIVNNACYAAYEARKSRGKGFMPTIRVRTSAVPEGVEIRVRDNGNGIPPDAREKVFTPFYTTKPAGKGTGLGLSITYDIIVQEHRGELHVESVENEFTEFVIRLRREPEAQESQA